jgi:transposase
MRCLELYDLIQSSQDVIIWCRDKFLLAREAFCPECQSGMKKCHHKCEDGTIWRCSKQVEGVRHFRSLSIRYLSLFEGSKQSIRDSLFLAYEWAANMPIVSAAHEFKLSKDVVINFYRKCRDIVAADVDRHVGELLGGAGQVVEIDECQLGRRKHQRGRVPREIWVFGVLVRGSYPQRIGLEIIPNRKRATLERVIRRIIDPRSRIVSDGWGGYVGLGQAGFDHSVVNHSENFVDQHDATIHTQGIENLWCCLRRFLRSKGTYTRRHLNDYLKELTFRKCTIDGFDCFVSAAERYYIQVSTQ